MWWMWIVAVAVILTSVALVEHQRALDQQVGRHGRHVAKRPQLPGRRGAA